MEMAKKGKKNRSDNEYFRMGAVVAVGEMYDMGLLGRCDDADREIRLMLSGFGVGGLDDMRALGMMGPYLQNFEALYA